jgi:hypothetical protein
MAAAILKFGDFDKAVLYHKAKLLQKRNGFFQIPDHCLYVRLFICAHSFFFDIDIIIKYYSICACLLTRRQVYLLTVSK